MKLEPTPVKQPRHTTDYELGRYNTFAIIYHLAKRHKFLLVTTYAVYMTIIWAVPMFWTIVASLV